MFLRELLKEALTRTGHGSTAVVGWGRGMGHKGHMYLANAVIHKAQEVNGDPYFVVSRTVGKDDPIYPEEKMEIYKKVFPDSSHIFQTATDEMPDLTRVLSNLNQQGYTNAIVVVGADQVKALAYVKNYNNTPDKTGKVHYKFDNLEVISRQETAAPDSQEEGPRATPMRQILMDPNASEEQKFAVWRDAMNPEIDDQQVLDLMHKAEQRMKAIPAGKAKKIKEGMMPKKNFAGSDKHKLGPAAHLKGKMKRPARAGDLVGAMEAFDSVSPVGGKRGSGPALYNYDSDAMRQATGTMETADDYEINGYHKLDDLLMKLCRLVVDGHKEDPVNNGMVAAGIKTKEYPFLARTGYMKGNRHVHAERAVIEAFLKKHGEIPKGSIMLVTLSPCNKHDDKTASERAGEPCSELIAKHGIEKVYCGLIDPSQAHGSEDHRHYTLIETENETIKELCEMFAETFLTIKTEDAAGVGIITKQNSTADVGPGTINKNLRAFKL
jgi:pyrimidine deaminase RibD-like protein